MSPLQTGAAGSERVLLETARRGDEAAFQGLLEPHRRELHAHCYQMLGSVHDADDALQDALLRAWRSLPKFDGRSSLRTWLYRIATSTTLDVIAKRKKHRALPIDHVPSSDPRADGVGQPLTESVWIEPYPDQALGIEDGYAAPDAKYERRESVELAFIAALQLLPANQRAALILREVLGFSAQETAEALDTTTASVNSALQRARKTIGDRVPAESQQATLRSLGDQRLAEIVESYMAAMASGDVDAVVAMLAEDAAWSMPPLASWFRGPDVRAFLALGPLSGDFRWRHVPVRVNGQAAVAVYNFSDEDGDHRPFALDVLTFSGTKITDVTAFITRVMTPEDDREYYRLWPDRANDPSKVTSVFERFGLPDRIA